MNWTRMSMSLTGAAAAFSAVAAGSTIWLLLTDPATLATAFTDGVITPLVRTVADLVVEVVRGLLTYL